ncbi:hypothetical protein ACIA5D_36670 [Actinoplanes sp. NPDC051513]|uniref:hypothetical protein n=1 Tax=Actinoplanes sp. NPDC051513 TaxID=3363908 RepID=UPI003789955F
MSPIEHLREWSASGDEWSEMCDLQRRSEDPEAKQRMAELLESYADRMERSGLVRLFASSFTPESLRAEAAEYRAGRDPHA